MCPSTIKHLASSNTESESSFSGIKGGNEWWEQVIIGGGAAGCFAGANWNFRGQAISSGYFGRSLLLEKTDRLLAKVAVSGGGRSNVTHREFDNKRFSSQYPRGSREMLGPLSRFGASALWSWFEERGVRLVAEEDGRVFPSTNSSKTIIDCLIAQLVKNGIEIRYKSEVISITAEKCARKGSYLRLLLKDGTSICSPCVLVTVGGKPKGEGFEFLNSLGHTISPPVPSLFTFNIHESKLLELQGVAVREAEVSCFDSQISSTGPVLVTHWGLSGPAVLKASAMGARLMAQCAYEFPLSIDWLPQCKQSSLVETLCHLRKSQPALQITRIDSFGLPRRLWQYLLAKAQWQGERIGEVSNQEIVKLVELIKKDSFFSRGRTTYREEFVTCGGVNLQEVDFRTMQSKICPGLYFAGEVLDIDGYTGGFNLQAAWTTAWIAAQAINGGSLIKIPSPFLAYDSMIVF